VAQPGLVHHSDAGGQYVSIRYSDRLADAGAVASIGTVGDSYDNAQAESLIGLYKLECVRHEGPWRGVDDIELGTLNWVHWFNNHGLHTALGHVPPAEFEDTYDRQINPDSTRSRENSPITKPGAVQCASAGVIGCARGTISTGSPASRPRFSAGAPAAVPGRAGRAGAARLWETSAVRRTTAGTGAHAARSRAAAPVRSASQTFADARDCPRSQDDSMAIS